MRRIAVLFGAIGLALFSQAASANLHWKGPNGIFEEKSSWVENNKVPTAEDFIIVKNYSGVNWSVAFTNDETSWKSELGTPRTNSETLFMLNGHAWALTLDLHHAERADECVPVRKVHRGRRATGAVRLLFGRYAGVAAIV